MSIKRYDVYEISEEVGKVVGMAIREVYELMKTKYDQFPDKKIIIDSIMRSLVEKQVGENESLKDVVLRKAKVKITGINEDDLKGMVSELVDEFRELLEKKMFENMRSSKLQKLKRDTKNFFKNLLTVITSKKVLTAGITSAIVSAGLTMFVGGSVVASIISGFLSVLFAVVLVMLFTSLTRKALDFYIWLFNLPFKLVKKVYDKIRSMFKKKVESEGGVENVSQQEVASMLSLTLESIMRVNRLARLYSIYW